MAQIVRKYTQQKLFISGFIIIILSWAVSATTQKTLWAPTSPLAPENRLWKLYIATIQARNLQSRIVHIAENLPSSATPAPVIPKDKQVSGSFCILHIGESVRSDHLSLFGYSKQTTPNLDKRTNIIAYRDCISVAPSTVPSSFAILTNAKTDIRNQSIDASLEASCNGIMDVFHALGYQCYAFLNAEQPNNIWGALYEKILHKALISSADKIITLPLGNNSHAQIEQISRQDYSDSRANYFIFINNIGSHFPFADYNQESPPFVPTSTTAHAENPKHNREAAEKVLNAYDNTIHYLDDYIEKLLSQFLGKPYVYLYISDHGDFFGDGGIWLRSGDKQAFFNSPVCQVPFILITSKEFEEQSPHIIHALEQLRQHQNMSIGQEHIFHTLLGLFGIQSPYYEEELDLTSDKVQPYTGPHPSRGGKASDGKKWY
ncbi:MAG: sulfatase-like hydrolase/transferase [Akkermansia sp.]|nr:sulfatase-like hydrolase/transferase [Akkermansia sp.]